MEDRYLGIFNDSYPPIIDGVTLTVQNYIRHLPKYGHTPCVVTPWNPVKEDDGVKVLRFFSLPIWNRHPYRYGYPKLDLKIWRTLRRTPFKLVHAHCPFSSGRLGVYVCRKQHIPLIATFHSKYKSDLQHSFHNTPWMVPIIMHRILSFFNAADHVWIPQAAVEETLREYGYKGPVDVVENGNDFASVPQAEVEEFCRAAREEMGIPQETLSLLFVGQHIRSKGIGLIADALRLIKDDVPFAMHFVGNGYAEEELRQTIERYGLSDRVTLHGMVTDREKLKRFYAAADLFLFPSLYDNAPLVVREAAAFHTPALLIQGSTASEVVQDGHNGFLAGASAEDYAEALRKLFTRKDDVARCGVNASRTLVRSWEDVVEEVNGRYTEILKSYK